MANIKYGLTILKKPNKSGPKAALAHFQDDDDDDNGMEDVNTMIRKESVKASTTRKVRDDLKAAMTEDPSVFAYDEIYDEMQAEKFANDPRVKVKSQGKPAPKYIKQLIQKAEERQKEYQLVEERKAHREREEEGSLFGEKEQFVTSAYKKQLLEMRAFEEKLNKKDAKDSSTGPDMTSFYRNLLTNDLAKEPSTVRTSDAAQKGKAGVEEPTPTPSAASSSAPQAGQARQPPTKSPSPVPGPAPAPASDPAPPSDPIPASDPAPAPRSAGPPSPGPLAKLSRHADDSAVSAARARYLARKASKGPLAVIED